MTFNEKVEDAAKIAFEAATELSWDLLPLDTRRSYIALATTYVTPLPPSLAKTFEDTFLLNYVP
jgi:hypothetical protein